MARPWERYQQQQPQQTAPAQTPWQRRQAAGPWSRYKQPADEPAVAAPMRQPSMLDAIAAPVQQPTIGQRLGGVTALPEAGPAVPGVNIAGAITGAREEAASAREFALRQQMPAGGFTLPSGELGVGTYAAGAARGLAEGAGVSAIGDIPAAALKLAAWTERMNRLRTNLNPQTSQVAQLRMQISEDYGQQANRVINDAAARWSRGVEEAVYQQGQVPFTQETMREVGRTVPVSLAAGLTPGGIGVIALAGSTAEDAYQQAVARGMGEADALKYSTLIGASEYVTEQLDRLTLIGRLLPPGTAGRALRAASPAKYLGLVALENTLSEDINTAAQYGVNALYDMPQDGTLRQQLENTTLISMLSGPLIGAGGLAAQARQRRIGNDAATMLSTPRTEGLSAEDASALDMERIAAVGVAADLMRQRNVPQPLVNRWQRSALLDVMEGSAVDLNKKLTDIPADINAQAVGAQAAPQAQQAPQAAPVAQEPAAQAAPAPQRQAPVPPPYTPEQAAADERRAMEAEAARVQQAAAQVALDAESQQLIDALATREEVEAVRAGSQDAELNAALDARLAELQAQPAPVETPQQSAQEIQQRDAEYAAAVERGDEKEAQRLVDEAAAQKGYTVGPVWHGTSADKPFTVFRMSDSESGQGAFFTDNAMMAADYTQDFDRALFGDGLGMINARLSITDALEYDAEGKRWYEVPLRKLLREAGGRGVVIKNVKDGKFYKDTEGTVFVAQSPQQIKSADAITRDSAGNVIPLSQRFDESKKEYMYMGIPLNTLVDAVVNSQTAQETRQALRNLGRRVYDAGATTWRAWHDRMRSLLGRVWGKVQGMMRQTWNDVRAETERERQRFARPMSNYRAGQRGFLKPEYVAKVAKMISGETAETKRALEKALETQSTISAMEQRIQYNPAEKWFEDSEEYKKSADPDIICQRSAGTDAAINRLKKALGIRYKTMHGWELLARVVQKDLPSPCRQCFVFSGRIKPETVKQQKRYAVGIGGYSGDVLRFRDNTLADITRRALRHFSSSDFKMEHIPGMIVEMYHCMQKGIPVAGYTKVGDFARIFGKTGAYINLSVGRNENVGMNMQEAIELRKEFPNVSIIYVAFNDAEVMRALNDPNIDHVIPWHASGQSVAEIRRAMNDDSIFDYTDVQYETDPETGNKAGNQVKEWEHGGDMQKYLALCEERGVRPKFWQFLDQLRGTENEQNYMKLIGPEYGKFNGTYPYKAASSLEIDYEAIDEMIARGSVVRDQNIDQYTSIADEIVADVDGGTFERSNEARVLEEGEFEGKERKNNGLVAAFINDERGSADTYFASGLEALEVGMKIGKGAYNAGAKTFSEWVSVMKEVCGKSWERIAKYARRIYNDVRAFTADERGMAGVGRTTALTPEQQARVDAAKELAKNRRTGERLIRRAEQREQRAEVRELKKQIREERKTADQRVKQVMQYGKAAAREAETTERRAERAKAAMEAARERRKEYQAAVDDNLATAAAMVRELVPVSLRGKLMADMTKARTKERLEKLSAKIGATIELEGQKQDTKKIIADVKKLDKKVREGKLKTVAPEYQRQIAEIAAMFDIKAGYKGLSDDKRAELEGLWDFILRNGVPFGISRSKLTELERLAKRPFSSLTYDEMTTMHQQLQRILLIGTLKQKLIERQAERIRRAELGALVSGTTNYDVQMPDKPRTEEALNELKRKAARFSFAFRFTDTLDGGKRFTGPNTRLIRDLGNAVNKAEVETDAAFIGALERMRQVDPNLSLDTDTPEGKKYWSQVTLKILIDQQLWEQAQSLISYEGLTQDDIDGITPQQRQVADILVDTMRPLGPRVAAVEETIHGELFELSPRYFPMRYRGFDIYDPKMASTNEGFYKQLRENIGQTVGPRQSPPSGFTIGRVTGVQKVPRIDLARVLHESLAEQYHYVNTEPVMYRVKNLVLTEEYERAAGTNAVDWWSRQLDIIARRGRASDYQVERISAALRGNLAKAILHYKATTILVQPTAAFDAASLATSLFGPDAGRRVMSSAMKAFGDRKATDGYIMQHPDLMLRRGMAGEDIMREIRDERKARGEGQTLAGRLISFGDIYVAAGAMREFEQILRENGSPNPADEAAILMSASNSSNNYAYRPQVFASGDMQKLMLIFQSFSLNRAGLIADDIINKGIVKAARAGDWSRAYRSMAALGAMEGAMLTEMSIRKGLKWGIAGMIGSLATALGLSVGGDDDEESLLDAIKQARRGKTEPLKQYGVGLLLDLLETNINNIPVIGDSLSAAYSGVRTGYSRDVQNPAVRFANNIVNGALVLGDQSVKIGSDQFNARKATLAGIDLVEGILALRGVPGTVQVGQFVRGAVRETMKPGTEKQKRRRR